MSAARRAQSRSVSTATRAAARTAPARTAPTRTAPARTAAARTAVTQILGDEAGSLLDVVDNVLNKGVVITGELTIALAQVDLVYARLSLLLCAADRILPAEDPQPIFRRRARRARRHLTNRGT